MASEQHVEELKSIVDLFDGLDEDLVMRPGIGNLSLKEKRENYFDKLKAKCDYYLKYAPGVSNEHVKRVTSVLTEIYNLLVNLNNADSQEYVNMVDETLQYLDSHEEELSKYNAHFTTVRIVDSGILEDEAIVQREAIVNSVLGTLDEHIKEAREAIKEAEQKRAIVVGEATKGSFKQAIGQFEGAQTAFDKEAKNWRNASIGLMGIFLGAVLIFLFWIKPEEGDPWELVIYHTAIRLTVLGVLGAATAFCLRVYRSQMHMARHNLHRQHVAKCMDAFVNAAVTEEQRDKILSILVESVATFGPSGLIRDRDDHMTSSRLVVDQFTKTLVPGSDQ